VGPGLLVGAALLASTEARAERPARLRAIDVRSPRRLELDLSGPVRVEAKALPAAGQRGPRAYFDLHPVILEPGVPRSLEVAHPDVAVIRVGQFDRTTARVVLELAPGEAPAGIARWVRGGLTLRASRDADALVVDPGPEVDLQAIVAELRAERAEAQPEAHASRPQLTVVVDPGHGGRDQGARGIGGIVEKTVNLKVARHLERELRARGHRVVLTRNDDRYLSLDARVARAHAAQADLVVSVHANAHRSPAVHGVETFHAGRRASAAARRLARVVQQSVVRAVRSRRGGARDLGVKRAGFFVLQNTRMPAILVEAGFLTHRREGRALARAAYRGAVARAIAAGVDRFARGRGATPQALALK
jgi:N-acetylmuramoyl-L-alanine amidase